MAIHATIGLGTPQYLIHMRQRSKPKMHGSMIFCLARWVEFEAEIADNPIN